MKISLQYSPLVKFAHGHAKVIHIAMVNYGFNVGSMKCKQEHSEGELGGESYGNDQFYSIPNIDGAMDCQSQNKHLMRTQVGKG